MPRDCAGKAIIIPSCCLGNLDPGSGCGTIASLKSRWFSLLVVIGLVALGAPIAHAQVFKPRTGNGKQVATAATANAAAGKKAPAAPAPAAASSRKPTRATGTTPRRVVTTAPAKKSRAARRHRDDDAADDDDVKITDD